jgi:hypothetical protein
VGAGGLAQAIEHLPKKYKVVNSNSSAEKTKKKQNKKKEEQRAYSLSSYTKIRGHRSKVKKVAAQ